VARSTHRKRGRTSFWVVVGILVIAVIGAGGYLLISSNSDSPDADGHTGGSKGEETPSVAAATIDLRLKGVTSSTIGTPDGTDAAQQKAARGVRAALAQFYEQAFLVKGNWDEANYTPAFASFVPESRQAATQDENLLTLGKDAPTTFSSVGYDNGDVSVQVLVDEQSQPKSAIAAVHFNATAQEQNGGTMAVRSVGHYFLRPEGDRWEIYGYQIRRKDKQQ
jgi:hypothetical protein